MLKLTVVNNLWNKAYGSYILYDSRVKAGSGRSYTEANGLLGPHVEDGVALMSMLFRE